MSETLKKVRIDFFIADVANIEIDVTDDLIENMMEQATQYLMLNGKVDWNTYSLMSDLTRFIFNQAALRIASERNDPVSNCKV